MPTDGLESCEVMDNERLGDGKCDYGDYNRVEFGFDHGDCCSDTCISNIYQCGDNGYDCQDPRDYLSYDPSDYLSSTEETINEEEKANAEEHGINEYQRISEEFERSHT
jgi:hypothetical protein